jgi:glycerophosphoryl diester phosphodiesterase
MSDPHGRRRPSLFFSGAPVAIAHRGGSALRPENSMAAVAHALALGVDAIECDVHLSRDGEPVVIHDATLDRTTDATGPVTALSADQLARVDAAYWFGRESGFPFRGQGIGVPRLATLLAETADRPVIVEIKGDDPRVALRALEVIDAAGASDRVVVAGFSHRVLSAVRRRVDRIVTSASKDEVRSAVRLAAVGLGPWRPRFQIFQAPVRFGDRRVLTPRLVGRLAAAHIPVQAWIVDDETEMRTLLGWGVTGLISDRPDRAIVVARAARNAAGPRG